MEPFSQRRHRLNSVEVEPVLESVEFRLNQLLEEKEDLLTASILFRVWYRIHTYCTSKPKYPPHDSWEEISAFLRFGTVSEGAGA